MWPKYNKNIHMKQLLCSLLLITVLFTATGFAQMDKQQATATIETYFDGWATSDTAKISKAMHTTCHLKFYRDGIFTDLNKNEYLARFKEPKTREATTKTRVLSLDITGNIAQAKTKIETDKAIFIDYFNLIKTNEGWFIVDKISIRTDKK
jgi:aldose sugar dehydrogenase